MSDQEEYEEREYDQTATSTPDGLDADLTQSRYMSTSPCTNDKCSTKVGTEPEKAWLDLMSAIPVRDQTVKARSDSMAMPNDMTVQQVVNDIRPADANGYAIQTIKEGWDDFQSKFKPSESTLKDALTALSEEWTGDDFDGFEEQVNTVIENIKQVLEDVGSIGDNSGALGLLNQKQEEIYALQGSGGEVPYPAPQLWWDDGGVWGVNEIHIRPPFWDKGECEKQEDPFGDGCGDPDAGGKKFMEMAGFDTERPDEIHNFIEDRTQYYMEKYKDEGIQEDDAKQLAQGDASETVQQDSEAAASNYEERASIVNQDVISRRDTTSTAVSEITPESVPNEETTLEDPNAPTSDLPGMDTPGGGGVPSPGGMDSLNPPGSPPSDFSTPGPGSGLDPDNPNISDYNPSTPDLDSPGLDDNPWEPGTTDPDDISGGLAGGGSGLGGGIGGPGGGLGGGLGGGAGGGIGGGGAGGGIGGGMMGAGGMGRGGGGAGAGRGGMKGAGGMGAGKGAGAGAGRGGRGMSGMMGGGGARGMGGTDDQDGKETWLTEEDDVWGIGNEDEDPYA
ncbi:hypothetical protein [Glycomyces arizonensis]|uniref:hypothetical protein n=1 Tax=Glycomyces arizonensis TaxID=256035 RepID=UPI0003F56AF0|nr:hypothetical protein [Glycomyces arizonensis]